MTFRYAVIPLAVASCVGCVPFKAYDLPSVNGFVRDNTTHEPIAGAQILVRSKNEASVQAKAVSDASGHFEAPEMTHAIWLPPLPFDLLVPDCMVRISAPGYVDQEFDFYDTLDEQREHAPGNGPDFDLRHN